MVMVSTIVLNESGCGCLEIYKLLPTQSSEAASHLPQTKSCGAGYHLQQVLLTYGSSTYHRRQKDADSRMIFERMSSCAAALFDDRKQIHDGILARAKEEIIKYANEWRISADNIKEAGPEMVSTAGRFQLFSLIFEAGD